MSPELNRRSLLRLVAGASATAAIAGGLSACSTETASSHSSSTTDPTASQSSSSNDVGTNSPTLFDGNAHEVTLSITDENLQTILDAYQQDNSKKWVSADVIIDGTEVKNIGVRLKGNSTVRALSGSEQQGGPGGGGSTAGIDAADSSTWPFLLGFDKNTDGQNYQGCTRLSLRPGTPVLNEAVALGMTAATDQPSQKYTYIKYTLNNQPQTTRLMIVVPDENYAEALGDGLLYKADSESSFSYQGDDPETYKDQFEQINGDDNEQPIIDLLKWVDEASDEEFDKNLGQYVDVESFARYVATQNLLVNADDMAGPGKNYYLYYDNSSKLISVVSWDLNMSMTGDTSTGPDDTVSMGGGGQGGNAETQGQQPPTGAGMGAAQGGMSTGNSLKTRFLASDAFTDQYHAAYWKLFKQIFENNAASDYLTHLKTKVLVTDGLTQSTLDQSTTTLSTWISERTTALTSQKSS